MRADNSSHLTTAARRRHEHTRAKAIAALHDLDRIGAVITFATLADHAGVSRSWLYKQTDIKDEIRRLRARDHRERPQAPTRPGASEESWQRRLELAHHRIKELTEEIKALRTQLALTHGHRRSERITTSKNPSTR
ncbi:DUF6262 family protein [Nocardia asteroides]|uniref:DUF6262 family protein n=1 Tax=Nocardia asteroides TaxID=1824 RepID=UPI0034137F40